MNNKVICICLFIFLFTLVACANVSLSTVTPTPMISSATSINTQSNVSTLDDPSAQATFDSIRASIAEEQESGIQQGNEIVGAIEKYYRETSQYPDIWMN